VLITDFDEYKDVVGDECRWLELSIKLGIIDPVNSIFTLSGLSTSPRKVTMENLPVDYWVTRYHSRTQLTEEPY
jgi:hypothetical protein